MSTKVNVREAKSRLSKLMKAALIGEDIIIARNGIPLVRLVPIRAGIKPRKPGAWSKLPPPSPDWDSPWLNHTIAEELAAGQRR